MFKYHEVVFGLTVNAIEYWKENQHICDCPLCSNWSIVTSPQIPAGTFHFSVAVFTLISGRCCSLCKNWKLALKL